MPLAHGLEVNAFTLDAPDGATLTAPLVMGAARCSGEEAVRDLARALVCGPGGAGAPCGGSPGQAAARLRDLPLVALSQAEIERLESAYPQIEDILPLSPLQEGLLFHALYDAQAPDIYTTQLELGLDGTLEEAVLKTAVQALAGAPCRACAPASSMRTSAGRCRSSCRRLTPPLAQHRSVVAG